MFVYAWFFPLAKTISFFSRMSTTEVFLSLLDLRTGILLAMRYPKNCYERQNQEQKPNLITDTEDISESLE